jgi:hypothetical protein
MAQRNVHVVIKTQSEARLDTACACPSGAQGLCHRAQDAHAKPPTQVKPPSDIVRHLIDVADNCYATLMEAITNSCSGVHSRAFKVYES